MYYDDDQSLPILERIAPSRRRLYAAEDIAWLLTDPSVKTSKIVCTKVPTFIQESVSFIVNLDSLENPDDVLADDLGAWKHNGVDTCHVHISFSRQRVKKVEKCKPGMSSASSYLVKRVYRIHGTDETLKKLTAYVYGKFYFYQYIEVQITSAHTGIYTCSSVAMYLSHDNFFV